MGSRVAGGVSHEGVRPAADAQVRAGYDEHECEFCGEVLPDPGASFLQHLDESDTCRFLWLRFRPRVQQEAGGS